MKSSQALSQVYVIHAVGTNRVKIGYSTVPQKRLKGLQTASPFPLRLLACWPDSIESERKLHRVFGSSRTVGEWFKVPRAALTKIAEIVRSGNAEQMHVLPPSIHGYQWRETLSQWKLLKRDPSISVNGIRSSRRRLVASYSMEAVARYCEMRRSSTGSTMAKAS